MNWGTPEQQNWIIQPLITAGLGLDQIRTLMFRLGFEAIISEGRGIVASVTSLVSDQPVEVQAAWTEMIGRMITLTSAGAGSRQGRGGAGPLRPADFRE